MLMVLGSVHLQWQPNPRLPSPNSDLRPAQRRCTQGHICGVIMGCGLLHSHQCSTLCSQYSYALWITTLSRHVAALAHTLRRHARTHPYIHTHTHLPMHGLLSCTDSEDTQSLTQRREIQSTDNHWYKKLVGDMSHVDANNSRKQLPFR